MPAFFITSTGTDIGKTLVTAALAWQLRQQGKNVTALKPIITGYDAADMESDTAIILRSCGIAPSPEVIKNVSPWRFAAPLSPNLAAAREGKRIDPNAVATYCREHAALQTGITLVEGAGGVMVPITDQHTMLDCMDKLGWSVIVVAGSYLGALSHTLTALEALRVRKLPVRALVISESAGSSVSLDDTVKGLAQLVPQDIPVVKLPRVREDKEPWKHLPNITWICR